MSTSRDLALDASGDLLIVGQDLAPLLADAVSIALDIQSSLLFFKGEWFLDQSQGIDWFGLFQSKLKPLAKLKSDAVSAIASCRGVTQVQSVVLNVSSANRSVSVTYQALTDSGLLQNTVHVSP